LSDTESKSRPTASGHRFGPDLQCSECGVTWDEHQAEPRPCEPVGKRVPADIHPLKTTEPASVEPPSVQEPIEEPIEPRIVKRR
jgi:hypothetical protein